MPAGLARYWRTHRRKGGSKRNRGYSSMAKSNHRKPSFTLPLAVVAGFAIPVSHAVTAQHSWDSRIKQFTMDMTGYNAWAGKWSIANMKAGMLPVVLGFLVHKFVGGSLGINRMLAQARVPFIRL